MNKKGAQTWRASLYLSLASAFGLDGGFAHVRHAPERILMLRVKPSSGSPSADIDQPR